MAKRKKLYAIFPNRAKNRSLLWCTDKWYETAEGHNFVFTKEQVREIEKNLPSHFILNATIQDENGSVEEWTAFAKKRAKMAKKVNTSEVVFVPLVIPTTI